VAGLDGLSTHELCSGYGYPEKLIVVVQMSFSLALIAMGFKKKAGEPS
jgi:hypothetical protein